MIGITNAGGGKDRYRVKVFGGTSAPANPKEGYIWVKTSTPISDYEMNCWSNVLPGYSMKDGFIYVYGEPAFDANRVVNIIFDKGNVIYFNFKKCMQQQGSTWHTMDAFVFHNGSWMQFSTTYNGELFYQGNQFTDVTGGWLPTGYRMAPWNEGWGQASPKMDIGTNMTVYQESNPKFGTIFTSQMIDVTNYRALKANVQYNLRGAGKNNGFWLGVCTNGLADQYTPLASFMAQTDTGEKSYDGDISIDISGITGRVFVFIAVIRHTHVSQYGTNPVTFRKIWLE